MSCHRCGEVLVGHHAIVIHIEGAELEHCLRMPWHTRVSCGPEMALIPPFALSWSTSRFVSLPIGQEKLPSGFHQVGSRGICQLDMRRREVSRARLAKVASSERFTVVRVVSLLLCEWCSIVYRVYSVQFSRAPADQSSFGSASPLQGLGSESSY